MRRSTRRYELAGLRGIRRRNGGEVPNRRELQFGVDRLKVAARIDMHRGPRNADRHDVVWEDWYLNMVRYKAHMEDNGMWAQSRDTRGNAIEQVVGLAYAAITNCRELRAGSIDRTDRGRRPSSQQAWADVWPVLQTLGLWPEVEGVHPVDVGFPPRPPYQ